MHRLHIGNEEVKAIVWESLLIVNKFIDIIWESWLIVVNKFIDIM